MVLFYLQTSKKDDLEHVSFLTPFVDLDIKELALYNYYNNLAPVIYPGKIENDYSSVQKLMKKFVEDLQLSYPSTITTIVKTGEKLTVGNQNNLNLCSFCKVMYKFIKLV